MEVNLEIFSGPLDLLLKLIRRKEVDIYDIPIAQVAEEYLEEIKTIPPDMGEMSEFLVLAASLLEIKSSMLLPKYDDKPQEDPREALVQKLIAYEEAQAFAKVLLNIAPENAVYSGPGEPELIKHLSQKKAAGPFMDLVSTRQLADIFNNVMKLREGRIDTVRAGYGEMQRERFTVTSKIGLIMDSLKEKGRLNLFSLFVVCQAKRELVVTFLALLELMRRGSIKTVQVKEFGDVEVLPCPA